jgi:hypothetical protein
MDMDTKNGWIMDAVEVAEWAERLDAELAAAWEEWDRWEYALKLALWILARLWEKKPVNPLTMPETLAEDGGAMRWEAAIEALRHHEILQPAGKIRVLPERIGGWAKHTIALPPYDEDDDNDDYFDALFELDDYVSRIGVSLWDAVGRKFALSAMLHERRKLAQAG